MSWRAIVWKGNDRFRVSSSGLFLTAENSLAKGRSQTLAVRGNPGSLPNNFVARNPKPGTQFSEFVIDHVTFVIF